MIENPLIAALLEMPAVRFSHESPELLNIENELNGFSLRLGLKNILDFQWVFSPFGEECIQVFLRDGGFLIISPNDFVFDVQQDGIIQVQNLPPVVSVKELLMGFEDYRQNPLPSGNYDENLGLFYFHLYIFKSALQRGIAVSMMDELIRIGKENEIWMQDN